MKNKKTLLAVLVHIIADLVLVVFLILVLSFETHNQSDFVLAENLDSNPDTEDSSVSYPYLKTFTISAYYSPLACQDRYVTGSYDGDIRLNGNGTNGADGTPVYPGMIAAPKTYDFGTKMDIPGVGIVAVHDRGGAIVSGNSNSGTYDRLDVWMGYGDIGLTRALNWGKRNVDVVVYGVNDGIVEQIALPGYSPDESTADDCSGWYEEESTTEIYFEPPLVVEDEDEFSDFDEEIVGSVEIDEKLTVNMQFGSSGNEVTKLQEELSNLNYYKGEFTGVYDDLTEHAVFKFQQGQGIVEDENSSGAGICGPATRSRLNEIIGSRNYTTILIAQTTANAQNYVAEAAEVPVPDKSDSIVVEDIDFSFSDGFEANVEEIPYLAYELNFGVVDSEVEKLQKFLKDQGYFSSPFITDYYGEKTFDAVLKFQIDHGIVVGEGENGAGRVGPSTLELINELA